MLEFAMQSESIVIHISKEGILIHDLSIRLGAEICGT